MSTYTISTDFAAKDILPESGDRVIKGSEFATEFNNIATAVNSKVDSSRVLTDVPSGAVFTDTVYTKPTNEPISYITGLQTALDDKVATTDTHYVKLTNVTVTSDEINYLSGVTSNIQTQIDNIGGSPWNVGSGFISIYNDAIHGGVFVYDNGGAGGAHYINIDHDASLPNAYYKHFTYQGTTVGSITRSGTTGVSYNTSSDYRLKENVVPVTNATDRVKQLNPCRFNFIGEERTVDGFLAHEAQAVVPESVTGEKDAVDSEGNPVYQGIDQSKLVPLLTAALQEALERIETLEATVNGGGA